MDQTSASMLRKTHNVTAIATSAHAALSSSPSSATVAVGSGTFGGALNNSIQLADDRDSTPFRFLSFNIYGILHAKYRRQRMAHFATHKIKDFDVICLQEQFDADDFEFLLANIPPAIRGQWFVKRFPTSFIGSGLAVLSRFEILHAQVHSFPLQGCAEKVYHGDFYANKSVAMVRLRVPVSGGGRDSFAEVTVFTTHLVAQYEKYSVLGSYESETYAAVRMSQAASLANFICSCSRPTDNVILCGDFNASPTSPEMRLLLAACQYGRSIELVRTIPDDDCTNFTYTFDNQFNTDSTSYLRFMNLQEDIPVQLDHILFAGPGLRLAPCALNAADVAPAFHARNSEAPCGVVVFTNNKEVTSGVATPPTCPLSDHYGVAARFVISLAQPDPLLAREPSSLLGSGRAPSSTMQSVHLPQLLVDQTSFRKSIEFAVSFLGRSAVKLQRETVRFTRLAFLCVLVPLVARIVEALMIWRAPTSDERGVLGNAVLGFSQVLVFPITTFVFGVCVVVFVLLGKLHRNNDAIVLAWQADELRNLLGPPPSVT